MKRRSIGIIAVIALCLCMSAGCAEEIVPPTLSPTLQNARVSVTAVDAAIYGTGSVSLSAEKTAAELTDGAGNTVAFSLISTDPETMSMTVGIAPPLMLSGKAVTSLTVSRDEAVTLSVDGKKDSFTLELYVPYTSPYSPLLGTEMLTDTELYYGNGILLTMYPNAYVDTHVFAMTSRDDPEHPMSGTYTVTEDTLTLSEDAGLSVAVFHRDDRHEAWRFDAKASARHTLSRMPVMEDGARLSFGFAYRIDRDLDYEYSYRITDFDGQTLLAKDRMGSKVVIEPLSPTVLRMTTYGSDAVMCYLNTQTGHCSPSYQNVITDTADYTVYCKDGAVVAESLDGSYTRYTHESMTLPRLKNVRQAMLCGKELTVSYNDTGGNTRICAWNVETGDAITRPLLIVALSGEERLYDRVLDESGTGFAADNTVLKQCELTDGCTLYYCGVRAAAVLHNGAYTDLAWSEKDYVTLRLEGNEEEAEALKSNAMTGAGIVARLEADEASGTVTATAQLEGRATVYQYNGMNAYYAVTVVTDADGRRDIYVGDADAALAHAAQNK